MLSLSDDRDIDDHADNLRDILHKIHSAQRCTYYFWALTCVLLLDDEVLGSGLCPADEFLDPGDINKYPRRPDTGSTLLELFLHCHFCLCGWI